MLQGTAYIPQQQFHLLIHFKDDERSVAVLPGTAGQFLVVDQGRVLGELAYDRQLNCVSAHCEVEPGILTQIKKGIRKHYS
jgi:hypothetical protein